MNAQNKEQSAQSTVLKLSKEELRRRILAVVNERGRATTMEIWRADAPNFLPWDAMIEEIKNLDRQKKLRREAVAPGHIVIHSLQSPQPASETTAAAKQSIAQAQTPIPTEPATGAATKAEAEPVTSSAAPEPNTTIAANATGSSKPPRRSRVKLKQTKAQASRPAKQLDAAPVTEAQLADLIEQGYQHSQVWEEHAYFLFQTGKQDDDGKPIFLCNALGAAFIARYGLEQAWAMWEAYGGAASLLMAEDTQLPLAIINQVASDHTSATDSLARIVQKLRAAHHAG